MRFFFLFAPFSLFSAYVGNPASAGIMNTGFFSMSNPWVKGTSGYIADYTSNKRYIADQTNSNFDPNSTFSHFILHSQMASLSLILLERLELFGMVGGSKERAKWHEAPPSSNPALIFFDFQSSYHFSWGAGAKLVLIQWGQTFLCSDFLYFAIPSSPKAFFKFFNRLNLPLDLKKQEFYLREWQVNVGLASRFFSCLTPYVGGTYMNSRLHIQSGPETGTVNYWNKYPIGYFFGITLSLTGRFHLTYERRVRDEFANTFSTVAVF